ncbi:wall-associated receptor kinase 2-like [Pyrus ussuriensis x Pyrus communis]|uniref:Wall-associated receptor kinase 2-like n=1 Tax=Pyrus ussuriensis x Pyrus communis TaxID=2448454 RepID=A0A5N5HTA3_9ROSA|nr:wall-associated receptor kinase 2-like [Pyrus ussuriensis x Pyrus communis]
MNEDRLLDILDDQVAVNTENVELLMESPKYAPIKLALKCLRMRGEERPTLKEVIAELQRIMNNAATN